MEGLYAKKRRLTNRSQVKTQQTQNSKHEKTERKKLRPITCPSYFQYCARCIFCVRRIFSTGNCNAFFKGFLKTFVFKKNRFLQRFFFLKKAFSK